ncbi:MAG TPA: hypothetical protein VMV46_09920 [Thermoanaerobaculia bacterium]|nr:hypothetical protein [Thermoanaerobaculia bacterium]
MKAKDVFTPGRFPTVTFVDDHLQDKSALLQDALEAGAMLISISGPSKSGKTVFVEQCLGRGNLIQVTGAGIDSPAALWMRVFEIIGTPVGGSDTSGQSAGGNYGASGGIEGNAILARGSANVSLGRQQSSSTSATSVRPFDALQVLIRELAQTEFVVFIDDFHYISSEVQESLAQQIKEALRSGVKFITASVPYHSDDVLRSNPDLRGRVTSIDFDYWASDTLRQIATKGFAELNIVADSQVVESLTKEAAGSPQLMQSLCLNGCFELGVRERAESETAFTSGRDLLQTICRRAALSADYGSIVEKMKEGPKTRGSERIIYETTAGWQGDVYRLLVKALSLDPPLLTFRYQELIGRIAGLCRGSSPSGSSVTSACQHTAEIVNGIQPDAIVEWDGANDVFDIRDPYLLFYLRWADSVDG